MICYADENDDRIRCIANTTNRARTQHMPVSPTF